MTAALLTLSGVSIFVGVGDMSLSGLLANPEELQLLLISRLPRTFAALLTGASLSVCGVIMQLLVRNKFVEPGTTGATEAAMLGVLAATILAPQWSVFLKMCAAACTALVGVLGFIFLVKRLPPQRPLLVPLVGLIYGGILGAGATFIAYQADLIQYIGIWMSGEFSGVLAGRYELLWIAGAMTVFAYLAADQFTVAGLGHDASRALGLRYSYVLAFGVSIVALVSALVVVTVGMLPFIGLVVPNLVSRFMGDNLRQSLPVVAGLGAGFVLLSDIIGRVVRYPYEIPAGTVFGILGAGIFLWLLLGRRSHV
jgi:iron complex transport system permease protein